MRALLSFVAVFILYLSLVHGAGLYYRRAAPSDWIQLDESERPAATAPVKFMIGLRQRNLDELERRFFAVSDPRSDEHQNFMSIDEIAELTAPLPEHREAVMKWLTQSGIDQSSIKDFIDTFEVSADVATVERMFETNLLSFKHTETGRTLINAVGLVSIPDELMEAVTIVTGFTTFPHPHLSKRRKLNAPLYPENDAILPQTIWNMYGIPSIPLGKSQVTQGVIEFEGEAFTNTDLQRFSALTGVSIVNLTANHIIGPNTGGGGEESTLDIQMVAGVNPSSTNYFWLEAGDNWLYEFGTHFFNTTDVPMISSISYGWWENDQCTIDGPMCQTLNVTSVGYVKAVDVLFQKIQMRGLTITVSSGDSGAHTRSDGGCNNAHLLADYPGTSPYITSVGATEVVAQTFFSPFQAPICTPTKQWNFTCVSNGYEIAVDRGRSYFTSGGGFSNISATPSYQSAAVTYYFEQDATVLPPAVMYNRMGRGRPDVSAVGHNAFIVDNGQEMLIGGTSQSSPIFAAVAALLTDEYIKQTGKPFGFLNQFLYQMYAADPTTFNDVIAGDNICPEGSCSPMCRGFIATYGWDPVTGLGTPNYPRMLAYVRSLGKQVMARRRTAHSTIAKTK